MLRKFGELYLHWHVHIRLRLTTQADLEIGPGISINRRTTRNFEEDLGSVVVP